MIAITYLIVFTVLETFDIPYYLGIINVLARICSTLYKVAGQIPCKLNLNSLTYMILNHHIYYPFLHKKVGLSD